MIRAVLDANVFISGILHAQGAPGQVLDAWRAEQFQLLISPPILEELERILHYPKIVTRHGWSQAMVQQFLFRLTTIAITTPGGLVLAVIDDPSDNRYLECAVEGKCSCLRAKAAHISGHLPLEFFNYLMYTDYRRLGHFPLTY